MKKTFALLLMLVLGLGVSVQAASLPEGYTEVEYIESQGAGYIDSGWNTSGVTSSYGYEMTFELGEQIPGVDTFLFGAYDEDALDNRMGVISVDTNGTTRISFGNTSSSNSAAANWTTTLDKQTVKVDVTKSGSSFTWALTKNGSTTGVTNATGTIATTPISDKNVWIFALGNGKLNGEYNRMSGKIYDLTIYADGEVVRDFVPCYRVSDEVAGLYDLVEGKFYHCPYEKNITYPSQEKALVVANAGIVVNADTGEIYYGQHIDRRHGQASMTKIMTCILTVENVPDVSERALVAIDMDHDDGSSMKLVTGEQHTIDDVLYGMMLPSGNDAAQLLARTVGHRLGGTFGTFVDMMNAKAHELGMVNTVYESPQGGYQTTAYDYAKLCEYGMRNELFRKYAYESFWTIEADPEYNVVEHNLTNANQLMPGLPYEYEGITGIKPGSTQPTRAHNAASATRIVNGKEVNLVVIVLGANENDSHHNRFTECTTLLDYGFEAAKNQPYTVTAEGNKLTIKNPVSGYTVEAVISAADTAYTGEPIEAAVVTTTYSEGTWNPNWDIKYENNVEKGTATASITYDGQTASCTFEIVEPTVTQTGDEMVDTLIVPAGQTYDLNGRALSVKTALSVNKGGKIVNGQLYINDGAIVSMGDNGGWVPVWTADFGDVNVYDLYPAEIKAGKTVVSTDGGTRYSFGYKLSDKGGYNPYTDSIAASAAGKIKFGVALELDNASANYNFSNESIEKMAGINSAASSDEFFKVNLTLAGSNNPLTKVRVAPMIKVSELGFCYVGETTGEAAADGEYVARVDNTFYWSLEDAIAAAEALAAQRGEVVDVMITKDINFERPVTFDMNGMVCLKTHCPVTISGPVTFDGGNRDAKCVLFHSGKDADFTLDGVTIRNYRNICDDGSTRAYGAIARVEGISTMTMKNCTVENCESHCRGVIYVTGTANLVLEDSSFSGNVAKTQYGGVVGAYTAESIAVKNCSFTDNTCAQYGGAIGVRAATSLAVENSTFTGNNGKTAAGAIRSAADTTTLRGVTMSGNIGAGKTGYDVYLPDGKGVLGGTNAIGTISLSEGVSVALENDFALAEGAGKIRIDGVVGETVLTGSKVAEVCTDFAGVTDDITVTEQGVLKSSKNYVAQVGSTMYESMVDAFEATKNATSATTIYLIGSEIFTEAATLTLGKYVNVIVDGKGVTISGPVTIDGQGVTNLSGTHTISVEGGGHLTLENGVTVKGIVSQTATSGAIRAFVGDLTLNGVTIENCTGVRGAVYMAGTTKLVINDCTFKNNTATDRGGALFLYGKSTPTTVTGTTFTGNSAASYGDTIFLTNGATLNFVDSTITGEGSNVYVNEGTFALKGAVAIDTVELVGGQTVTLNDTVTIADTIAIKGNAGQKVLSGSKVADYYEKFVSVSESEVIDSAGVLKDMSGVSYVAQVDGEKYTSLAQAVAAAKAAGLTDIDLIGSETFTEATTIALDNIRLNVTAGMIAKLSGPLTLTGGEAAAHVIYVNGGTLTLDGVTVKDHFNNDSNGAMAVANKGSLTLNNCEISGLKAKRGALYLNGANGAFSFSATNTKFTNNTSTTFGGALSLYGAVSATLTGCSFTGNTAAEYGGAIGSYSANAAVSAANTEFKNNTAGSFGGVISTRDSSAVTGVKFDFTDCTFTGNESGSAKSSGVMYLRSGVTATVTGGSMTGNSSGTTGAVANVNGGTLTITGATITGNTAGTATDAALRLAGSGKLTLDGVTMSGNSAYDVLHSTGTLTLKGATGMESIYLASGRTIALDDSFSCTTGQISVDGAAIANGTTVLTGSNTVLADHFTDFTLADETLEIGDGGKAETAYIPV